VPVKDITAITDTATGTAPAADDGVCDNVEHDKMQIEHAGLGAGEPIPFHPFANIFPMVSEDELRTLADDIKQHGLLDPITTLSGEILDGRCRSLACRMAGVKPTFVEYIGDDPLGLVLSKNARRRQLDDSQRAMVAAKLADLPVGANQHSEGLPIGRAAKLLNVGERSVGRAREVLRLGPPELVRAVESGNLPVSVAAKQCHALRPAQTQSEAEQQRKADIQDRDQSLNLAHEQAQVDEKIWMRGAFSMSVDSLR
jgi:ParB-like chromosome segregation protein Spo0J